MNRCSFALIPDLPGVSLLFADDQLARVDVTKTNVATDTGIRVGDPEAAVLDAYGSDVKATEHTYDPEGQYLTVVSKETDNQLIFETDGTEVTYMRAGRLPEVGYVEGCA